MQPGNMNQSSPERLLSSLISNAHRRQRIDIFLREQEEIYHFQKNTFRRELEKYESMPEGVGHCFVILAKSFDVYIEYHKNQPGSNRLINSSNIINLPVR